MAKLPASEKGRNKDVRIDNLVSMNSRADGLNVRVVVRIRPLNKIELAAENEVNLPLERLRPAAPGVHLTLFLLGPTRLFLFLIMKTRKETRIASGRSRLVTPRSVSSTK